MTEKFETIEILRLKQVRMEIELPFKFATSSFLVAQWLQEEIGDESQELLVLLCLNTKNEIVSYSVVHKGTLNQSVACPRDIFQRAILSNSARIIIAHNHPSNNTTPSVNDNMFTERMKLASDIIGIQLLDHIIVSTDNYYSYQEQGELKGE